MKTALFIMTIFITTSALAQIQTRLAQRTPGFENESGDQLLCPNANPYFGPQWLTFGKHRRNGRADILLSGREFLNIDIRNCKNLSISSAQRLGRHSVGDIVKCENDTYTVERFRKNGEADIKVLTSVLIDGPYNGRRDITDCQNITETDETQVDGHQIGDEVQCSTKSYTIERFRRNGYADLNENGRIIRFQKLQYCRNITRISDNSDRGIQSDRDSSRRGSQSLSPRVSHQ
jgi:hypothetical protein